MKKFAAITVFAALAACSSVGPAPPTERPVVEATACPELGVTIYFEPTATTFPASADPVIATVSQTIERCRARFSPVKEVLIAGHANRGGDGAAADASANARAQAVRQKFIDLGIRANRVKIVPHDEIDDDPGQPLRRHADVKIIFGVKK